MWTDCEFRHKFPQVLSTSRLASSTLRTEVFVLRSGIMGKSHPRHLVTRDLFEGKGMKMRRRECLIPQIHSL